MGIEAHGVNPKAIESMKEVGIDISNQQSKTIDMERLNKADYVITLCGDAVERCPMTPPHVKREHWGFEILRKQMELKKKLGCISSSP